MQAFLSPALQTHLFNRPFSRRHTLVHRALCPVKCKLSSSEQTEASAMAAAAATFILQRAAKSYTKGERRPQPLVVLQALLQLEKAQKRNKVTVDGSKIVGQWRLVFTGDPRTKNPLLRKLYFPVRAHQTFTAEEDGSEFDNAIHVGFVHFHVTGPFRWVTARNRLEFTVDRAKLSLGPLKWQKDDLEKDKVPFEQRTSRTLPFFTFFLLRENLAAARGRSGGLALYAKVPEGEELY